MIRRAAVAVVLAILVLMPASPAFAQAIDEPRDQVVLSGYVIVPRGRTVGEVVVITGSVTVLGVVQGDVIVIDGPATIAGQVSGDVVVLDGSLILRETAQVAGDVLTADPVEREEGSQVDGEIREGFRATLEGPAGALGALLVATAMAASTLILMGLVVAIAPRGVERLALAARTAPFASAAWGLGAAVLVPVLAVILAATIIGLPLGLAVLLALGLWFLVGVAAGALAIGRAILQPPRSRVGALFAGWAMVAVVGLVPVLNVVAWILVSVFGLGVLLVATWRARGTSKHRVGGVPPERPDAARPIG